MKQTLHYLLFLFVIPLVIGSCKPSSQVREYTETILTYPVSDTSPFAIINIRNDIYPYSRFDGYSHTGQPQEWKMVKLENDYVEVYAYSGDASPTHSGTSTYTNFSGHQVY